MDRRTFSKGSAASALMLVAIMRRCETRCPFHVKIFERMHKAAALFGI